MIKHNITNMNVIHEIPNNKKTTIKPRNPTFKKIVIRENVYQQLKDLGRAGDSFNDVLEKILSHQQGAYHIDVRTEK